MSDLRKKTIQGIAYLGAGKSLGRVISFINTLILARLLSPSDYGLMAMAMVVADFIGFLNEVGLGSAIVQRQQVSKRQLDGAFVLAMLISLALFVVVFVSAPFFAGFYNNVQVEPVLQVLALNFVIGAMVTVPEALMRKEMRFKELSVIQFLIIIIQCVVALVLAIYGFGVWALVFGFLAAQVFRVLAVGVRAKWLVSSLGDMKGTLSLMRFGLSVTLSRMTWYVYSNADNFIIGRVLGERLLGFYSMAFSIATLPTSNITSLVVNVASPLFSKLQDDVEGLNRALNKLTSGLAIICFPVLGGLAVTANELVPVLLGDKWLPSILPLQILCLIGVFKAIDPLLTQALTSIGRAFVVVVYTTTCAIFLPISIYIGAVYGGIEGVAIGLVITYPVLFLFLFKLCHSYYQLSVRAYMAAISTPLLGSILMCLVVSVVRFLLLDMGQNTIVVLAAEVIAGIVIYSTWMIYIRLDGLQQLHTVLTELGVGEGRLSGWPFSRLNHK